MTYLESGSGMPSYPHTVYKANSPINPKSKKIIPTDTVPTVTSNIPVTGVPLLVSGIAARAEGVGVTVVPALVVLGLGLA